MHFTEADGEQDGEQEGEEEFLDPIDEGDELQDEGEEAEHGEDEVPDGEGSDGGLAELAEVLTLTAKKLSSMTLGRKFTGRPTKSPKGNGKSGKSSSGSAADRKRVTHCSACGQLGHWHEDQECPLNGGGSSNREKTANQQPRSSPSTSKTHKVGILHHEHGATEVSTPSASSYGNMFTVNMIDRFVGAPFEINEVKVSGPEMYAGYMVLDTGCQRTCCGAQWVKAHTLHLKEFGLHPKFLDFPDSFKFGKGTPSHAITKGYYPSAIGGQPLLLASSTLNEQIPFLASNSLLTGLGAVFSLVNDTIVFKRLGGAKAKICRLGGHMAICISDFQVDEPSRLEVWQEFSSDALWENPHPEFILSSQIREVSLPQLTNLLADDPSTSGMAEELETGGLALEETW